VGEKLSTVCLVFEDALTDLEGGLEEFGVFGGAGFEAFHHTGAVPVTLVALSIICVWERMRKRGGKGRIECLQGRYLIGDFECRENRKG